MHTVSPEHTVGAAIGTALGFVKSLTMISMVSWGAVLDTAVLSGVGTLVGLLIGTIYKRLFKSKNKTQ